MVSVYFPGELFSLKHLVGNAALEIYKLGFRRCMSPVNFNPQKALRKSWLRSQKEKGRLIVPESGQRTHFHRYAEKFSTPYR
jgi:hypothetical protein